MLDEPVHSDAGAASSSPDEGDATKPGETILRQEIETGMEQLRRPTSGLLLSAVSAGLDVGFGTLTSRLVTALAYSIGFVIVILGKSELFTEHTTLAILPLLSGQTTMRRVARLWAMVYAGNLIGAMAFAALAVALGPGLHLFTAADVARLCDDITAFGAWVIFGSGVAAGWMMGLVSWLVTAARDTVGQVLLIILVTGAISFLHLHHSIAGSVEVLMGVWTGHVSPLGFARFLGLATAGNAIGGIVLVAGVKYGHVRKA